MTEGPQIDLPQWYVVRTQTRREHIAANLLRELEGVEVFCPRIRYRKATRRGKIWWVEPLFPGYLMAKFVLPTMERAVTFNQGVRGLVRFGASVPTVPETLVTRLRRELTENPQTEGEILTLLPTIELGEEVEIAHGPFQGMRGPVLDVLPGKDRVRILLEFLGQPQRIDIDLFSLLLPRRPHPQPSPEEDPP